MTRDPTPGDAPFPLVDVVCVAGDRPRSLELFLQSWINQTAPNWRLTVWYEGREATRDRILGDYAAADDRIRLRNAPAIHANQANQLRELALREAMGDYVLLVRDRDYYIPRFIEFATGAIRGTAADVVLFDMVHNYDQPGGVHLPAYCVFETEFATYRLDIGTAIVRGDLARAAGFRDRSQNGDQTYFEDVFRAKGDGLRLAKLHKVLFVHN